MATATDMDRSVGLLAESVHIKQKRARGQLSCTPCRVGKLKCNRVREPACDQCIKRNREDACQYVPPPAKAKPVANVKGRIRQLESLVKDLMVQQAKSQPDGTVQDQPTPPSDNDDLEASRRATTMDANVEKSFGQLEINQEEISYKGENHWQTILSSLSDIQKDLVDDDDNHERVEDRSSEKNSGQLLTPPSGESPSPSSDFILGHAKSMTRDELINAVPEKRVTDRLLSLWFNSPDPFKIIIHAPSFQEEYKCFWRDQSVSTMWLGLLFSILCLAEGFGLRNGEPEDPATVKCSEKVDLYQSLTASAVVLAEYTKPKAYTIECLLLHMSSMRSSNALVNAWLVTGVAVRLALRMGYHRDPGHYPKLSPFHAEMRRRVWAMTSMIDILMSFQLGLPSMVRIVAADTLPPKNLLDRDFNQQMSFLPIGREEHELTPALYTRAKLRLMHVFSESAEISHSVVPPTFETILKLDRDLEQAKTDVPPALRMPDISELVTDQAEQLMCRFNLDLLYNKTKIVLFRRYMLVPLAQLSKSEQESGIGEGRLACINSARTVLDHHHTIWNAIQPGGQLQDMRWYMGSISTHDFLLAAMVVCLELSQQLEKDKLLRISSQMYCPQRQGMMRALEQSYKIWESYSGLDQTQTLHANGSNIGYKGGMMIDETTKARKAMASMLSRLKRRYPVLENMPGGIDAQAPVQQVREEPPDSTQAYRETMGLTPTSARVVREKAGAFHGVLTNHNWGSIPENFQFSSLQNSKSPTESLAAASIEQQSSNIGMDPMLMQSLGDPAHLDDDAMNLDWQAWDTEILSFPDGQTMEWDNHASPMAMAQMSQSLASVQTHPVQNLAGQSQPYAQYDAAHPADLAAMQHMPLDSGWTPFLPLDVRRNGYSMKQTTWDDENDMMNGMKKG